VLLTGEPGTGKTRLLQEASARLESELGALVLRGFAMPGAGEPPYFALGRATRRLSRVADLAAHIGTVAVGLLSAADLWPASSRDASVSLDAGEGRVRLLEALAETLAEASTSRPLLVVLDDMQWASREDWDAVAYVARVVEAPLAFIVAARPEVGDTAVAAASAIHELSRARLLHRTALHRLSDNAVEELAGVVLGGRVDSRLLALLLQTCRGNPFLVEEFCARAESDQSLQVIEGAWTIDRSAARVPGAATFAVVQRLAELPPAVRTMVECAAVLGRSGAVADLGRIPGLSGSDVAGMVAVARRAGVFAGSDGGEAWQFPHDIVREAILDGAPSLRDLHRKVAEGLSSDRDANPRAVATHWADAGEPAEAARVALRGTVAALRRFAPHEAVDLARLAVEQAAQASEALLAEAEATLGDAALEAGDLHEAENAYRRLESIAARVDAPMLVGRARVGMGIVARHRERPDESVLHLRAGIHALAPLPAAAKHVVRARVELAGVYGLTRADYTAAESEAGAAVDAARILGDAGLESEALLALANARVRSIGPTSARSDLEGALERALGGRQLRVAAEAAASLSNNYYWTGELRRARHFGELRLEVAREANDLYGLRHGRSWLALLATSAGDWTTALRLLDEDEAWLQRLESPEPYAFATIVRALVRFRLGEFERAFDHASSAIRNLEPLGDGTLLWYAGLWANVALAAGRTEAARAAVEAQEARLATVEVAALPARSARCALAPIYAQLEMTDSGAACEAGLRPFADDYHWWSARLSLAELALLRGDRAQALRDVDAGLAVARREGQLPDVALLLALRSRALGGVGTGARKASDEAMSIADQTGMHLPSSGQLHSPSPAGNLTPRELEVVRMIALGLSNREIASRLVLSDRTVINHVSHILDKLGVDNRSAAAAWAIRAGVA